MRNCRGLGLCALALGAGILIGGLCWSNICGGRPRLFLHFENPLQDAVQKPGGASGSVEASVLYIPEKEEGLRSLHFQIPFQCYGEGQGDSSCENLDIRSIHDPGDVAAAVRHDVLPHRLAGKGCEAELLVVAPAISEDKSRRSFASGISHCHPPVYNGSRPRDRGERE